MYAAAAQRLSRAGDQDSAYKAINDLREKLRDRVPTFEEFYVNFSQLIYTKSVTKDRKLVKYVLAMFQQHFSPAQHYDFENMSIEHLVPQAELANGQLDESIVGQFGNLILLDPKVNSSLGKKSFQEKRKLLVDANYAFESELLELQEFGEKEIKERTDRLSKIAYEVIWKI